MMKIFIRISLLVVVVLALCASFFVGQWYEKQRVDNEISSHPLLAKRIFLSKPNDILVNFEPLRSQLKQDLEYYDDAGKVSVYFEYLPTGTSIRVGDKKEIIGASLLKVPAAMELYKLAEKGKISLDKTVALKESWLDSNYGELYKKGAGYKLTVHELARIMIEQSDNTALNGIQEVIKPFVSITSPSSAYNALDVEFTDSESTDLQLSARSYSSFLKCLYFACYISTDSSQEIMSYLTHSTDGKSNKIRKYLPKDVKIAHKIGVAGDMSQADCGVVYVPNRNYVLCVMLEESEDRGSEVIAQVSKKVYDYVNDL